MPMPIWHPARKQRGDYHSITHHRPRPPCATAHFAHPIIFAGTFFKRTRTPPEKSRESAVDGLASSLLKQFPDKMVPDLKAVFA